MDLDNAEDALISRIDWLDLLTDPWLHAELPKFLSYDEASTLAAAFDDVDLTRYEKDRAHKPYKLSNHLLEPCYEPAETDWQRLAAVLQGAAYRGRARRASRVRSARHADYAQHVGLRPGGLAWAASGRPAEGRDADHLPVAQPGSDTMVDGWRS